MADAIGRQLKTLFSVGVTAEFDDSALVERYSRRGGAASEAAFRLLVERHGPMVLRVCRQVLGDGHDAQDASQAVFLVLARKAATIRDRGSVAPWLHGVACRVATRARRRAAVRRANERRTAEAVASGPEGRPVPHPPGHWEAVHEEVARLPEKYRAPVILCYLEGLTYEEAARRIGCPLGTVRVRLSRARERLRARLTRRGFGPEPAAWLGGGPVEPLSPSLPAGWVESTVRSAEVFASGRAAEVGTVSATSLALSREVLRSMTVTKIKIVALGLLTTGAMAAGGQALTGRQAEPPKADTPPAAAKPAAPEAPDREREVADRILDAARKRLKAQRAFYEEGRITIDRYLDASSQLMWAELQVASTREQRVEAARDHLARTKAILKRELDELKIGRSTNADVAEAQLRVDQAELDVIHAQKSAASFPEAPDSEREVAGRVSDATRKHTQKSGGPREYQDLERRLSSVEQKLDRVIKALGRSGIDAPDVKVKQTEPLRK